MAKEKKAVITNARTINKMRSIVGLAIASVVIALTLVALTLNIIDFYQESSPEAGLGTLRMYTTLSNILATLAASICVPFQIDGLRKNKFKIPNWVVEVMYVGATGVFVTFTIAISLITATSGFSYAMFGHSNLFMHTLNPIFITLLFLVAIPDTRLKFKTSFFAIIPTFAYALLYFIMVFATGIWRDHYGLQGFLPWPVTFILLMLVAFGIAQLLRVLHNLNNRRVMRNIEKYFKESPDFEFEKVTQAIAKLAEEDSKFYKEGDEISIPADIIKLLAERYKATSLPLDIQYDIYLENYLINIHGEQEAYRQYKIDHKL